jgi:hypothetical protein
VWAVDWTEAVRGHIYVAGRHASGGNEVFLVVIRLLVFLAFFNNPTLGFLRSCDIPQLGAIQKPFNMLSRVLFKVHSHHAEIDLSYRCEHRKTIGDATLVGCPLVNLPPLGELEFVVGTLWLGFRGILLLFSSIYAILDICQTSTRDEKGHEIYTCVCRRPTYWSAA